MSNDLVLLATDALPNLPIKDLRRGISTLKADMSRSAGSLAGDALKRVIGAYPPPKDFANPQEFVDQAIMALEDFPAIIIQEMADPKVGIVREARFLPRIAELVKWCEGRITRYRLACSEAEYVLSHREREVTIRRLQEEADAAAAQDRARDEAARCIEPEILARLRNFTVWSPNRPRRAGEERAREAWQAAMAARLSRRPDLVEPYLTILAGHPELALWATERENSYRGSGWPDLSRRMCGMFEASRREPASAPGEDVMPASAEAS